MIKILLSNKRNQMNCRSKYPRILSSISFNLDINPASLTTAQEKGVRIVKSKSGKMFPTFYKKKKSVENETLIMNLLKPFIPNHPLFGYDERILALVLTIVYFFPHTSSARKSERDNITFMTNRPDVDNLSKAFIDCMTKCRFWSDDSCISLKEFKFRSPNPHMSVIIDQYVWDEFEDNSTSIRPNDVKNILEILL